MYKWCILQTVIMNFYFFEVLSFLFYLYASSANVSQTDLSSVGRAEDCSHSQINP
jgi:hypothetical protein